MRTFHYLGGCPTIVVPDNLRAAVTKAHRYDPDLNKTYQDMSVHYGVAVVPARCAKPRDKAKVENGVLLAERWILAKLRHHRFFALAELNAHIRRLLAELNQRPFKKLPGSRRSQFAQVDYPAPAIQSVTVYGSPRRRLSNAGRNLAVLLAHASRGR